MQLHLVRHIQTEYNQNGIYMGRSNDLPILNDQRESFAVRAKAFGAKKLNRTSVRMYSSPALRCRQTADVLAQSLLFESHFEIADELNETNYGEFEGRTAPEIKKLYPSVFSDWMENPAKVQFPGGESFTDVQTRAIAFMQRVIMCSSEAVTDVYIITHVDIIKFIICWAIQVSIDRKRLFRIDNGSFTTIETTDDRHNTNHVRLAVLNYL